MPANRLIFKNASEVRDSITESQKQQIANLYEQWADDIQKLANKYAMKTTKSAPVSQRYYEELKKQLRETSHQISNEVYNKIKNNMYLVSDAVVKDNVKWLNGLGFPKKGVNAAFSFVPDSVVRSIATGQVYDSGWSLSKRIWGNNEETLKQLYEIVAGGVAKQTPIYDIAKQLENYVRPSAAKQWNLTAKDGRKIYPRQVDYNAQRLARTLVQHSYQQAFVATTENNPFITDYIWIANGSRVCELCLARDGQHYKKDELPLDHPNGMCVMEPNVVDNLADKLVDWFNSDEGTYPEIDEFAKQLGYTPDSSAFNDYQKEFLTPGGFTPKNMPEDIVDWYEKVEYKIVEKAEETAKEMGLDFETFYNKYIGNPNAPKRLTKEWIVENIYSNKMTNNTHINQSMLDDIIKVLNNDNVSDEYRRAFAYAMSKMNNWTSIDGGSYYSPGRKRINIDLGSIRPSTNQIGPLNMQNGYTTLFHEVGHGIDATKGKTVYTGQKNFQNAMLKDLKNLQNKLDSGKMSYAYLHEITDDGNSRGVQDVLGACKFIDGGKFYKIGERRYVWGHSDAYWQRKDATVEAASELFAHISAAQVSSASMKYVDEFFPESKKQFEKVIEKVAKKYTK